VELTDVTKLQTLSNFQSKILKISENASSQDVRAAPIQIQNISKSMERMADRAIGQWRCEESILGDRRCNAVDKLRIDTICGMKTPN
jgi:hypothetical protein